jgi:hypothetical protein
LLDGFFLGLRRCRLRLRRRDWRGLGRSLGDLSRRLLIGLGFEIVQEAVKIILRRSYIANDGVSDCRADGNNVPKIRHIYLLLLILKILYYFCAQGSSA